VARGEETRRRILREAIHLFAEHGFKGTTVADIESAAGLSPGSGALFAHFASKEAVLECAVEELVSVNRQGQSLFDLARIGDLRSELTVFARAWLMGMDNNRDLVRLWLKESDRFPQLRVVMEREINQPAVTWVAGYLRGKVKDGELEDHDCEAVATIVGGALAAWWIWGQLAGEVPPSIDEDRFVYGWVDLLMRLAPSKPKLRPPRTKS
jgi:AcrR family transcriptional regulator